MIKAETAERVFGKSAEYRPLLEVSNNSIKKSVEIPRFSACHHLTEKFNAISYQKFACLVG